MFYLIDGDRIAARWRSLPRNWRDPETGDIHTRVPGDHPRLRVGVQQPVPMITTPFQKLRRVDGFYDPETDTVTESWAVETVSIDHARRMARDIINSERDRRIAAGFDFDSGDAAVQVDTRNANDFRNIAALVQSAQIQVSRGVDTPVVFRGADDVTVDLTPVQAIDLGLAVAASRAAAYRWAWSVKDSIAGAECLDDLVAVLRAEDLL